ncbi:hypothetical protein EAI_01798 [Harpegnathos saltator]|uniref:MYND-type domain-containing protein n=2 Tax=Harpegnathos saltator TaxID=610380 RepID=E2BBU4_HARSA|nr:hypothetical protein EAI_01798 [Harpegnathos saltator]
MRQNNWNNDWADVIPPNLSEPDAYNNFFYPDLCHVCKGTNGGNLILCNECLSISYCSVEHKHLHREDHTEFCVNMKKFLRLRSKYEKYSPSRVDWVNSRRDLLRIMKKEMRRLLMPCEEEMIMFAKSCYVCFQEFDLKVCNICYSASYCEQHEQQFLIKHNKHCPDLTFCLNLEMRLAGIKFDYDFSIFPDDMRHVDDMESFVKNYCCWVMFPEFWTSKEYFYTDFVSTPLTVYYGMIKAEIDILNGHTQCFVCHVITSSYLEADYAAAWELLLHGLHEIKELTVVLIGLEPKAENSCFDLCRKCKEHGRSLKFEFSRMLHHEYINNPLNKRPNVIIRFDVDLHDEVTLIDVLSSLRCPNFFISTSESIAQEIKTTLRNLTEESYCPMYSRRNNFRSFQPRRDFKTGTIYYRNNYVTIYESFSCNT